MDKFKPGQLTWRQSERKYTGLAKSSIKVGLKVLLNTFAAFSITTLFLHVFTSMGINLLLITQGIFNVSLSVFTSFSLLYSKETFC